MRLMHLPCPHCGKFVRFEIPTLGEELEEIAKWHSEDIDCIAAKDSMERIFDELREGKTLESEDSFSFCVTPRLCKGCGKTFTPQDIKWVEKEDGETVSIPKAPSC